MAGVAAGVMVVAGCWFSLLPGSEAGRVWDAGYGGHAGAFAALCGVGSCAVEKKKWVGVALVAAAVGLGVEMAQTMVPGRGFEWRDLAADGVGIAVGLGAAWGLTYLCRRDKLKV